jgi:cytochrome oxidase Cu insertion factor (SCO1/SenC/PrrC family)
MNAHVIDKELQKKSRLKIIAVFSIFLGPLLLAFVWLQLVKNDASLGTSSKGQLISPAVPITAFNLKEPMVGEFTAESLTKVWSMVYLLNGTCTQVCEQNLYHMRQIRLSLVQNMDRVQRVLVTSEEHVLAAALLEQHIGLRAVTGNTDELEALANQISEAESSLTASQDALYLIDPLGNIMMRFPADLNPKLILKDIKHLLKVSRIG